VAEATKRGTLQIAFRLGDLESAILLRSAEPTGAEASATVRRIVARYLDLVECELDQIELSEPEAALVCDALNGLWMGEAAAVRLLWAEVADAIAHDRLDAKWGVDGEALVAKLRRLTPGQRLALLDSVERFWLQADRPAAEVLREVGLVRGGR
jgi:hypothetical protein